MKYGKNVNVGMKKISERNGYVPSVEQYYSNRHQINLMNTKTKELITECSKCGKRFTNWPYATPCCRGLSVIVESGKKTTRVYLSTLTIPRNINYENSNQIN